MKIPLVLNVTNYVAMNFSANALLAVGASPLMSFYADEMEELVRQSDSLLINIGCLDAEFSGAAIKAAATAVEFGKPWILDPVGVGVSAQRNELCLRLVKESKPTIIRANASEINCLSSLISGKKYNCEGRGVDATICTSKVLNAAKELAARTATVVSMSGETDYITDGDKTLRIDGGSEIMSQVSAMGCTSSALSAAYAAKIQDPYEAACTTMKLMAAAGEMAAARTKLPGSFNMEFIDALSRLSRKRLDKQSLRLYLVTDRTLAGDRDIQEIVREAVSGGVTMVQLREKDCDTDTFIKLAKDLERTLKPHGIPLIINDRVDVALAANADGVHLGQSDMSCETARRLLGPDRIIGLSVENIDQVIKANELDVDYIGISPVLATATKMDTSAPFGFDGLREAARLSCHPAVAIGGMNVSNAAKAIAAGAAGIAVVSAIVCADDPCRAAQDMIIAIDDVS